MFITSKKFISKSCIISYIPIGNVEEFEFEFAICGFFALSILILGEWISIQTYVHFNWIENLLIVALIKN